MKATLWLPPPLEDEFAMGCDGGGTNRGFFGAAGGGVLISEDLRAAFFLIAFFGTFGAFFTGAAFSTVFSAGAFLVTFFAGAFFATFSATFFIGFFLASFFTTAFLTVFLTADFFALFFAGVFLVGFVAAPFGAFFAVGRFAASATGFFEAGFLVFFFAAMMGFEMENRKKVRNNQSTFGFSREDSAVDYPFILNTSRGKFRKAQKSFPTFLAAELEIRGTFPNLPLRHAT